MVEYERPRGATIKAQQSALGAGDGNVNIRFYDYFFRLTPSP